MYWISIVYYCVNWYVIIHMYNFKPMIHIVYIYKDYHAVFSVNSALRKLERE